MANKQSKENIDAIVEEYGNSVLRMCYLYLKDYQLAEDVTQETFIKVYEKIDTFRHDASIKTWIMSIAINLCKNQMRTHWFKRTSLEHFPELATKDVYGEILKNNVISMEIMRLQPKYREIILLYYYQELSVKEISTILGMKEATVLQRMKRAREQLKPFLKEVL